MKLICLKGESLNTIVYRGYAKASDLARISEPDVFDQTANPEGTQRDLKPWHAREAHAYADGAVERQTKYRIWPEILLNARDPSVVVTSKPDSNNLVKIKVLTEKIIKKNGVDPQISRVDGNHRLFYAAGYSDKTRKTKLKPLDVFVPFAMTIGLPRKEEAALFGDINSNAVKMNTSHLDHLRYRIVGEETIKKEELPLWIAEDLASDSESPFFDSVFLGGKRTPGKIYLISLDTLKVGVQTLLRESQELVKSEIPFDLKSKAIKNFWRAIKNTFLNEWNKPKTNMLLSYFAYLALSKLGAIVIDRSIRKVNPTIDEMQAQLLGVKNNINWAKDGTFKGFGGKGGADRAFEEMEKWLPLEYKLEEALKKLRES